MPAPLHPESALGRLIRNSREKVLIETESGVRRPMTQIELADALKSTQQTVSRWEAGKIMPPMAKLHDLAQILDIDPADITAAAMAQAKSHPEEEVEPSRLQALEGEVAGIKDALAEILKRLPSGPSKGAQRGPAAAKAPSRSTPARTRSGPVRAVKKAR